MNSSRRITRTATSLFLAAVALVWLSTSGTLGGFTKGYLANNTSATRTASLSIANSIGGTGCSAVATTVTTPNACTSTLYPTSVGTTAASGATNGITNKGTVTSAAMSSNYKLAGCGPVSAANAVANGPNSVLLPRNNATFSTSGPFNGSGGSLVLDGSTGTYAASVGSTSEPVLASGDTFGVGIWFKTSAATTGPLFSFSASPLNNASSTSDRTVYLDSTGRIGLWLTSTTNAVSTTRYNDNVWHFAYLSVSYVSRTSFSGTLSVDAKSVIAGTVTDTLASYPGYWHVGWGAKPSVGYFNGSLGGFVVDDSGDAPATISTKPTSYSFDTTTRTEAWDLSDSGGAYNGTSVSGIYTGTTYPSGAANPCGSVTATWTLTSPAATVASSGTTLSSLTTNAATVADPDPGVTQTSTISLVHASNINSYLVGLNVYAPVVSTYTVGSWKVAFTWSGGASLAGNDTTFVIA